MPNLMGLERTHPLPRLKNASRTPSGRQRGVTPRSNGHCDAVLLRN